MVTKMNPDKLTLFQLLKADEAAGTIHFQHRRMLLMDADAMGLLRKELIETVGIDRARRILTRFGYACGYRDALTTKDWQVGETIADWWSLGPRLHTLEGMVRVRILNSRIDKASGVFDVDAEWVNSYEAEQHRTHLGVADSPVCWTLVGYATGHATAVFGRDVWCEEKECVEKGDARCLAIARAAHESGEQMRALKADDEEENIQAELGRLLEAFDRREKDLKRQEAKVSVLESQLMMLREAIKESAGAEEIVGTSAAFRKVMKEVERVALSDTTVLICGETGTGKDMIARALHAHSERKGRQFITVDCAALPASLVESELFGHEKGAFTGAVKQKLGRFEIANGGTIFLDEVGELPIETQVKFLRLLQRGEFERVGGTRTIKVDARVLAATNQQLDKLMAEGRFRQDLFYRLNTFTIHVPPLCERPDDIILLTHYFVERYSSRFKKEIASVDQRSLERLRQYHWPGNVRELEHIIERAVMLADEEVLTIDVPFTSRPHRPESITEQWEPRSLTTLSKMEQAYIEEVLRHTNGLIAGKGGAAEILGLPASTLRHRMKKLGLK
jgi:transcriptional regulator with PAS, ATPase and Fis domain